MRKPHLSKGRMACLLWITLMWVAPASAMNPGDTKILTQMYVAIKEQVTTLKKELEEVKAVNEGIFEAREYLSAVRGEYEFATRFDPDQELRSLIGMADGMTNLNDLEDKNWQQRWALLSQEMDKRFNKPEIEEEASEAAADDQLESMSSLEQARMLQDFYRKKALEGNPQATAKDYQRQTASATAMMTSIMLEQRAERLEADIARRENFLDAMERDQALMRYMEGKY
jgi:hypothetical protein